MLTLWRLTIVYMASMALLIPSESKACATVSPEEQLAQMLSENTLIVWDARKKTEHFIRTVKFVRDGKPTTIGFIVPTPSMPELKEASASIFSELDGYVWAHEQRKLYPSSSRMGGDEDVHVLDRRVVAGMEAVVLETSNASALSRWVKDNGFAERDSLKDWMEPYVKAGWKFSAFKYTPKPQSAANVSSPDSSDSPRAHSMPPRPTQIETKTVRLSFKSASPVYPYREPSDSKSPADRILNLYVVASGPILVQPPRSSIRWRFPASRYSGRLQEGKKLLRLALPQDAIPDRLWLTAYEDRTTTRPDADLVFHVSHPSKSK